MVKRLKKLRPVRAGSEKNKSSQAQNPKSAEEKQFFSCFSGEKWLINVTGNSYR